MVVYEGYTITVASFQQKVYVLVFIFIGKNILKNYPIG